MICSYLCIALQRILNSKSQANVNSFSFLLTNDLSYMLFYITLRIHIDSANKLTKQCLVIMLFVRFSIENPQHLRWIVLFWYCFINFILKKLSFAFWNTISWSGKTKLLKVRNSNTRAILSNTWIWVTSIF